MIRRSTSYGPKLPDGELEDDGADRGIIFVFVGAHIKRQFEFVKTQWLNDGIFIGAPNEANRSWAPAITRTASRFHSGRSGAGSGTSAFRGHPRGRVLLRPEPAGDALASGATLSRLTKESTT